ncbi:hypothetical protein [Candidatus Hakubella thermalkaliphila]|uniref:hypothetical protein n=1 Tax=Candidatus Hakubella thermalkaliphila TaxID=2754717 RepID=UPI001593A5B4|nr:hypothetical protein [Candidatus Hakubella thermalkaliphila]
MHRGAPRRMKIMLFSRDENWVIFKGIAHAPRRTTSHENYVIFKGGRIRNRSAR